MKFLIVLDDVREFVNLTDIGLSPLPDQGVNFKVLMTSRDQNVCRQMKVNVYSILNVEVLTDLESQHLFLHLARDSKDDDVDLRNIGDKIATKCLGIPAVIKMTAFTLKGQPKEVWEDSLSSLNHHQSHEVVDGIFDMIYDNLKEETRSTLLLCGLFHKDLDTPKEDLVRYAWGLNLFRNVYTIQEARNRLNKNIEELKLANLLIKRQDVGCVMMDDVVRAFVFRIYSKGKHAIVGDMSKWPTKDESEFSKRISLTCTGMSVFPTNCKYPNLLLLKLIHGDGPLQFHDDFYQEMRKLEVLVYEEMRCPLTFRSLGCSTNLRTLCFRRCSRMFDLSPIGDLFNLEMLSFVDCHMGKLPSTIGKLKNLKLLEWRGNNDPCIKNGVLKKLVNLEELYIRKYLKWNVMDKKVNNLTMVNVGELATCSKNLVALEIEFLDNKALPKSMSFKQLRRFKISLGCSLEEEEDRKNGHSFENKLMLVTNNGNLVDSGLYELFKETKVLHLQVDDIRDGLVKSYPHQSSFTNMRVLQIVKCVNLRYLFTVPVANGLTKLERLKVSSCLVLETLLESDNSGVEDITFQALKFLSLGELPKLTSFCNAVNAIELPQLEELILESLPKFTSMQTFLNKKIVITHLKKIKICKMENLKELWPSNGGEVSSSPLKEIEVEGCQSLVNLFPINPMSSFLHHLEEVKVTNCDSINVLFNIELGRDETNACNSKLKSIKLVDLRNLRDIWVVKGVNASNRWIMGFEALEIIEIFRCKSLDAVLPPNALKFDMRGLTKVIIDDDDDWLKKNQKKGKRLEEISDTNVFWNQSRVVNANQVSQFEGMSSKYTEGSSSNAQPRHHMRDASTHEPTTTEDLESKSSYGNRSMEEEMLKEKSLKYEKDRDEVEWKHKAEPDAQRKETIDQLARQIALSEQFSTFMKQFSTFMEQCSAFMMQFESTNSPPPPSPSPE